VSLSSDPWIWLQAIVVLCVFSFLYKDNPIFSSAQSFYVGAAAGHGIIMSIQNLRSLVLTPLNQGKMIVIIPVILALMLLARFFKGYTWVSRIAMAVPVGVGAGVALRAIPGAQIWKQIASSAANVSTIDGWIMLVGVVATIVFFLFTTAQNSTIHSIGQVGLGFMCITFGVTFAGAILTYISIFYGPAGNVFGQWLGLVK
jgi:hypothetical protein